MKINLPLTGQERLFPADQSLVSRTDTKGIITFANDAFMEVCGFSRQELIGANHNIIRHPDVPPVIFESMWATLKQGLPWHGVVKNRCKNGDHYWVEAKVVPVKKNGEIIGYMSVRGCPSREAITAAEEAYGIAAQNPAAVWAGSDPGWKKHFSIKNGVTLGIVFVTLLMVAGGILGITGLKMSNSALRSLFYDEMESVQAIGRINLLMADNRAQVALALHHDPAAHGAGELDHDLGAHIRVMDRNKTEIDHLWQSYTRGIKSDAERELSEKYWQSRSRYVENGLAAARTALLDGDYRQAETLLLNRVAPLYDEANFQVGQLQKYLTDRGKANFVQATDLNRGIAAVAIAGISLGTLILVLGGICFFRATVLPLQKAVGALENIAEGNLMDEVGANAPGEPGRVMAAVTVMQMHLKVMINEIRQSAESIRGQCRSLNQTMMNLAEQSEEQHDRVYQTLDASEGACAGLSALASNATALAQEVEGQVPAAVGEASDGGVDSFLEAGSVGDLGFLAGEVAGAARIQAFALEEVSSQLKQVASLVVQNREEVQGAWAASQQLEKTAVELDRLVKYFEA